MQSFSGSKRKNSTCLRRECVLVLDALEVRIGGERVLAQIGGDCRRANDGDLDGAFVLADVLHQIHLGAQCFEKS